MNKNIPFRQGNDKGCGYYTLANLFNEKEFIEGVDLNKHSRIEWLNARMRAVDFGLFIDPVFMTNAHLPVGNRLTKTQSYIFELAKPDPGDTTAGEIAPFVLCIHGNGVNHYVGMLFDLKTELCFIIDSCKDEVIACGVPWLMKHYWILSVSVFGITGHENPAAYLMLSREDCAHLLPNFE